MPYAFCTLLLNLFETFDSALLISESGKKDKTKNMFVMHFMQA